jgi:integrase
VWLPLSTRAVELLKTRQRVNGSPFVFTSWGATGHLKDPRDMMKKVSGVAGTKITPHDLRRTFITFGVTECGIDLHKIELLTNHVPRGVTAKHYLETSHLQYLRPEVQRIADWMAEKARIAKAIATGQNVVALRA